MGTPATKKPMQKNGTADKQSPPDQRGAPTQMGTPNKQVNRGKVEGMDNTAVKTGVQDSNVHEMAGAEGHPQTFPARWTELKSQARIRWPQLDDDDIKNIGGRYDLLVEALQRRYGYEEVRAEQEIDAFLNEH